MKLVKFKQTSAGSYGLAQTGDELTVTDTVASHLEKTGVVEVLGDSDEDPSVPTKGSVRFTDETGKGEAPAGETDPKNVTGPDKKAPKAAPKKSKK
jgi:hypothetical protein